MFNNLYNSNNNNDKYLKSYTSYIYSMHMCFLITRGRMFMVLTNTNK